MSGRPRDILTRPAPRPDRTVRYGEHAAHVADVWEAPGPTVMFVHGGFWRAAWDRVHARALCAALARRGHRVASVEYRRTGMPGGGWPGTFDDVEAAVAALEPAVVAGHSAGGHLALWAAARAGLPALALAPVCDLVAAHDLGLDGDAAAALLGGGPEEVPERYAAATPGACRCAILHGDLDPHVPVGLSRRYAAAAGRECDYRELEGVEHFALIDPTSPAWPAVTAALGHLLSAERARVPGGS